MMNEYPDNLGDDVLRRARSVKLLALDVDGILTDGRLLYLPDGQEAKGFHPRDGLGLKALQRFGIDLALITGRQSRVVARRAEELGIKHVYQATDDKWPAMESVLEATGLKPTQICYAGDDWLDLPVLLRVGLAVTVADADIEVRTRVHYVTSVAGGRGAAREICGVLLKAQNLYDDWLSEFVPDSDT